MIPPTKTYCALLIAALLAPTFCHLMFGGSSHVPDSAESKVLATVGTHRITVREFRDSYEFGPAFVKHAPDPKAAHLQYLINEKLIALDGYAHGIDTLGSMKRMLKEIEDDLAVTEWCRQSLLPQVHVDSARVRHGVEEKGIRIVFRSIHTDNYDRINDIRKHLKRGMPFDSLYASLKSDPTFSVHTVADNFFVVHESNARVADTLARMRPGTLSGIIRAASGFYLVRLDRVEKNLITTATEYENMWGEVERHYAREALDSLTFSFARKTLEDCPPTISGEALKAMLKWCANAATQSQNSDKYQGGLQKLAHSEVAVQQNPGGEPLVTSKCDRFTIQEFALWYSYREVGIDFSRLTSSTLQTVKDLIFRMVRDKRIIKLAREQGYGNDPNVQFEMSVWNDKCSYWKQRAAVLKEPAPTEEELQNFYAEHKHRYENKPGGLPLTFDQARDKVKADLVLFEYNKQLFYYLNGLKQRYAVHVDEALLRSLHVSDQGLSKKVDVVIMKKGGTLPRQAFPTIDNEWQFFQ